MVLQIKQYGGDMQKHFINGVTPGAIIAEDVIGRDGVLLLKKGSVFREQHKSRFKEAGVNELYIENTGPMTKETIDHIQNALNLNDIIHDRTRNHAHNQIKKMMMRFRSLSQNDVVKVGRIVESLIEELLDQKDFVFALTQLRAVDDYTYHHSVNVGVLALVIGIELNLKNDELKKLGIGAILHDIGKVMISEDIIKKPSKLTPQEYEEVKKHTIYGYEILMEANVPEESAQIALHHHEKFDGSGYTYGLKKTKIPLFARVVAVADVYDAMSNDRVYQKKFRPDRVYREIARQGGKHFDVDIMEKFARHISIYPTGTGVILNTGHRGIVIEQNRMYPESPVVRMFTPQEKNLKKLYFDIDLSSELMYRIIDTY